MKVLRVISESRDKQRREVIAEHNGVKRTYHIRRSSGVWHYCNGASKTSDGQRIYMFTPIDVGGERSELL
jgi:hypothetical protein